MCVSLPLCRIHSVTKPSVDTAAKLTAACGEQGVRKRAIQKALPYHYKDAHVAPSKSAQSSTKSGHAGSDAMPCKQMPCRAPASLVAARPGSRRGPHAARRRCCCAPAAPSTAGAAVHISHESCCISTAILVHTSSLGRSCCLLLQAACRQTQEQEMRGQLAATAGRLHAASCSLNRFTCDRRSKTQTVPS